MRDAQSEKPPCRIEKIWCKDELRERYGQSGPYSFMVEAQDGFAFGNAWQGDAVVELTGGVHGYRPEKGPHAVFMAHGPSFRDGAFVPEAKLVDIAPTLAATFGQHLPEADGCVLSELLK